MLQVRNHAPGPLVFTDDASKVAIEWQGAGDANGGDVQEISDVVASNYHFRRAISRGLLTVESTGDVSLDDLVGLRRPSVQDVDRLAVEQTIKRETQNDLVSVPCQGPSPRGGQCNADVLMRVTQRASRPPLCSTHEGLASQYVVVSTDLVDGVQIPTWTRSSVGPVQRGDNTPMVTDAEDLQ